MIIEHLWESFSVEGLWFSLLRSSITVNEYGGSRGEEEGVFSNILCLCRKEGRGKQAFTLQFSLLFIPILTSGVPGSLPWYKSFSCSLNPGHPERYR